MGANLQFLQENYGESAIDKNTKVITREPPDGILLQRHPRRVGPQRRKRLQKQIQERLELLGRQSSQVAQNHATPRGLRVLPTKSGMVRLEAVGNSLDPCLRQSAPKEKGFPS